MAEKKLPAKQEVLLPQTSIKGRGFEHEVDKNDYIIPRAKLLQALSPEVAATGSKLKAGQIINSLTLEALPITFVPLFWFPQWIRFNARKPGEAGWEANYAAGAMIWRSKDPSDPRVLEEGKFGDNGEVPLATKFLNFFSIFIGHSMPVIISFSKTSYKAGKKLITLASLTGGDMFGKQYNLSSKFIDGEQGKYHILEVNPSGLLANDSKAFKVSEILYENYKEKPVEVHEVDKGEANDVEDIKT